MSSNALFSSKYVNYTWSPPIWRYFEPAFEILRNWQKLPLFPWYPTDFTEIQTISEYDFTASNVLFLSKNVIT